MQKIKNLKQAENLAEIYLDITADDLNYPSEIEDITGYGSSNTCSLCFVRDEDAETSDETCKDCFYVLLTGERCTEGVNAYTYDAIKGISVEEVVIAVGERGRYINTLLKGVE